jgi:hypothetical protein
MMQKAWAIQFRLTDRFCGVFWFDTASLPDYLDGQRIGLFRTRAAARAAMKAHPSMISKLKVVRVHVSIATPARIVTQGGRAK